VDTLAWVRRAPHGAVCLGVAKRQKTCFTGTQRRNYIATSLSGMTRPIDGVMSAASKAKPSSIAQSLN
jgi:hypothetical protein